jgi:hypothetical protein
MKSIAATICLLFTVMSTAAAQKVIRLYPGPAPGSENWTQQEKAFDL